MAGEFNERKWFRNQYIEEAGLNEDGPIQSKEEAFKILRNIEANMHKWDVQSNLEGEFYKNQLGQALDFLQADEIGAMFRKEKENKY